jgi:hypothetical protein
MVWKFGSLQQVHEHLLRIHVNKTNVFGCFSYRWILQNKSLESWLVVLCIKPKTQFNIDFKPEFW